MTDQYLKSQYSDWLFLTWDKTIRSSSFNVSLTSKLHTNRIRVLENFQTNLSLYQKQAWPIEGLAMQRVYEYITKVMNMPDHRLHKQARNIRCKVQKTNKSKIISSGWVLDIMKTFKRWGVKDLLELSGDSMKYVIIEDKL